MGTPRPNGTLGERIAFYRQARGLSQPELAQRAGVHAMTVSKWERDQIEPSSTRLRDVAVTLRVSMSMLVGRENPETEAALAAFEKALVEMEGKPLREDERVFLRVIIESFFRVGSPKPPVLLDFLSAFRKSPELRALFFQPTAADAAKLKGA